VRIGASLRSGYGAVDARTGARYMIERAAAANAAGLDSLFIGDHHNVGGAPYYQNVPMLGRLLAEWGDNPAGALFLLPLWHPVLLAEQVGTLASIASGRFIVQCALGGGDAQFAAFDVPLRRRPSRFEATLDIMRRLCAGETVTTDAPFRIERARISPVPPEPIEVWIGAAAPPAIDRAARLGDGFLAGPETVAEESRVIDEYLERCAEHDRKPTAIAIRRDVHVAATSQEARNTVQPIIDAGYRGFSPDALVYGSVAEVADAFARLGALGYTDVIIRHLVDDQTRVLESFESLGYVRGALMEN
jgi:alkanesulfonate monooxygenase SsuD/methylene tetrahydromethanopterin reductase-like flavin-dependent oxidoreductase (luciferase family)